MDPNEVEVKNNDRRNWIATIVAGTVLGDALLKLSEIFDVKI